MQAVYDYSDMFTNTLLTKDDNLQSVFEQRSFKYWRVVLPIATKSDRIVGGKGTALTLSSLAWPAFPRRFYSFLTGLQNFISVGCVKNF
jgi:hypothetical protein